MTITLQMMKSEKVHKGISVAIILSELGHVFCCVLPSIFSALSLMAGLGMISVVPSFMVEWHEVMHKWEIPVISGSGALLLIGWIAYNISIRVDCHDTGCGHPPCEPKKQRSAKILWIATILFAVNITIYLLIHA